jgi:hypothetical protein
VELRGVVRVDGGALCAGAQLRPRTEQIVALTDLCVPGGEAAALADSVARFGMLALWTSEQPLLAGLPRSAVPRTTQGVAAWAHAERLFSQGRWGEAYAAYLAAESADTTCWLYLWRLHFAENWMSYPHDEDRFRRFVAHIDRFPPHYQSVMRASALPMAQRLDTLRQVTRQYPNFFFGGGSWGKSSSTARPSAGAGGAKRWNCSTGPRA